jgi:hypothetical protein
MSFIATYRTSHDGRTEPILPEKIFEQIWSLTDKSVVSRETGESGLAAAIAPQLVARWMKIPGARLTCLTSADQLIGFALYFVDQQNLPDSVSSLSVLSSRLAPCAYAHLIVVDPQARGKERDVYGCLLKASLAELSPKHTAVLAWVRLENERAMRAHEARGWCRTGIHCPMLIGERSYPSEYLVFPLSKRKEEIEELIANGLP